MKKILTYIFLLINISYYFGLEQIFKKANSLYHQQEFKNAITEYNKILEKGMESTELYFNIGNCYFQLALIEEISNNYDDLRKYSLELHNNKNNIKILDKKELLEKEINNKLFSLYYLDKNDISIINSYFN